MQVRNQLRLATILLILVALVSVPAPRTPAATEPCGDTGLFPQFSYNKVVYGDGRFLAYDDRGLISSTDGIIWRFNTALGGRQIADIAFGQGQFVAVGSKGAVYTSPDGLSWTARTSGITKNLSAVAFGGDLWVAVGEDAAILTSPDGITWTDRSHKIKTEKIRDVAYGGGRFVAVGGFYGYYYTSADGLTWDFHQLSPSYFQGLSHVAWGDGQFVASGSGTDIFVSATGESWTQQAVKGFDSFSMISDLRFADGHFLTYTSNAAYVSANGTVWSKFGPKWPSLSYVTYGDGLWVGLDLTGQIYTSLDFDHWGTQQRGTEAPFLKDVAFGNGRFVAVSSGGPVLLSEDGSNWRMCQQKLPNEMAYSLLFQDGRFIAVGYSGAVWTSTDGGTWMKVQPEHEGYAINRVAQGPKGYVAVGPRGRIWLSADLKDWTPGTSGVETDLLDVAYGNGLYVIVGRNRTLLTSPDGVTWTARNPDMQGDLGAVAFDGKRFWAGGSAFLSSADGMTWSRQTAPFQGYIYHVRYASEQLFVAGYDVWVSADASSWRQLVKTDTVDDLAFGNDTLVVLNSDSMITVSTRPPAPEPACSSPFPDVASGIPACAAIQRLVKRGIVGGNPDGTFQPNAPLTRAQAAKMLVTARGESLQPAAPVPFSDVAEHWAATQGYLQAAYRLGIIQGYSDGTFMPDASITRAELLKLAVSLVEKAPTAGPTPYADVAATDWYAPWVATAARLKLIGKDAASPVWAGAALGADREATRAEAAMVIDNVLQLLQSR